MLEFTIDDIDLLEQLVVYEARARFHAYRQYMHPKLKLGWFVESLDAHLENFVHELEAGLRPKLVLVTPPQHGKSSAIVDLACWIAGRNPDLKTIFTSYSERLGVRANLACQRAFDSQKFKKVFPEFRISTPGRPDTFGATRNRELVEFIDYDGFFRNTTVNGSITGESLDLGIIDDPIKGRKAANSKATRDSIWNWFSDDFLPRFSDEAGLLYVGTRWHVDDPVNRLRDSLGDELKVIRYPAYAEADEEFRKEGEPLFPELKSKKFLEGISSVMSKSSWGALYQGSPILEGGNIIQGGWFQRHLVLPKLVERAIYGDTALKKEEANDYTVFQCWGKGENGRAHLVDQVRGKWEAPELEKRAYDFWEKHKAQDSFEMGVLRKIKIEDKASGTGLIQKLKLGGEGKIPLPIIGIPRNRDRYTRVCDVLGYIEAGWVSIPDRAPFISDFIQECEEFTSDDSHSHDDQIDPMCDAITDFVSSKNVISIWQRLAS